MPKNIHAGAWTVIRVNRSHLDDFLIRAAHFKWHIDQLRPLSTPHHISIIITALTSGQIHTIWVAPVPPARKCGYFRRGAILAGQTPPWDSYTTTRSDALILLMIMALVVSVQ